VKDFLLDALQLFFRMIPHPTKPRLIVFGKPGRNSPVLVTVNSSLTVRRLSKALKGENCYLLVAPARGINVWCGSVGGHFTIESIISIIRTSGIERHVDHRRIILPQLSAPTITSKELYARAGWSAQFGPIRAEDIPEYLRNGKRVTTAMTEIRYSPKDRLEMAIAMSGSIIVRYSLFPLIIFGLWGVSRFATSVLFTSAMLHLFNEKLPGSNNTRKALSISPLFFSLLLAFSWASGGTSFWLFLFLTMISLSAAVLAGSAYAGYTPFKQCTYSRQFYGYAPLEINIVAEDCTGCTLCDWVCPVDCFAPVRQNTNRTIFVMANPANCVECGACLVQCPTSAVVNLFEVSKEQSHLRCA
jgi:NAD-dependent dihydropyrimidine dehydrogenase PreA subunit